ncbi:MAG: ATP-binding protein [Acidobacteriales bacterium]|nr:ATP-binding protein [Terriglobales bacterium]
MRVSSHRLFLASAGVFLLVCLGFALYVKPTFWLKVFADVTQFAMVAAAFVLMARNVRVARGRARIFWVMMSLGMLFWCVNAFSWVYYEVIHSQPLPAFSFGDLGRFFLPVPFLAAVAVRPDRSSHPSHLELGRLDFVLLMLWWVFVYCFVVFPWVYVIRNRHAYESGFDILSAIENLLLLVVLGLVWIRTKNLWRRLYWQLFIAQALHAASAGLMVAAIRHQRYYSGGIYDVLLSVSMLWFIYIAIVGSRYTGERRPESVAIHREPAWPGHLAALAVLSLPLLALWSVFLSTAPQIVREYRLSLALGGMLGMTLLVYLKQRVLNKELQRLLEDAKASFENLKRLQRQVVTSEKLAAVGQLVAGAAHEINNPLTAILGYAELLSGDAALAKEPRSFVEKIAAQAKRTQRLVANLLSFAKQSPAVKAPVNLNTLLEHATQMCEGDVKNKSIQITRSLYADLPLVLGDSNHLLQVFLHILNNAVDALKDVGGGLLQVATRCENEFAVVEISDTGPGIKEPERIFEPFYTTKPVGQGSGLGLSACYGIVQDHGGTITCYNRPGGGASFVITLPGELDRMGEATTIEVVTASPRS